VSLARCNFSGRRLDGVVFFRAGFSRTWTQWSDAHTTYKGPREHLVFAPEIAKSTEQAGARRRCPLPPSGGAVWSARRYQQMLRRASHRFFRPRLLPHETLTPNTRPHDFLFFTYNSLLCSSFHFLKTIVALRVGRR